MDFRLYASILWRFRLIVAAGLVLAIVAAALSVVRIGPGGVGYRQSELWASTARLGVTQQGFPWGRLFAQPPTSADGSVSGGASGRDQIPIANPDRFNALAILYAELATSDPVRALMLGDGPVRGQIVATPLRDADSGVLLPLIDLTGISDSPEGSVALTSRGVDALQRYLETEQSSNEVPSSDRVVLQELTRPMHAQVFRPRSKTMAAVVFLAVAFATVALVFVLENLRPRFRNVDESAQTPVSSAARRRTA